PRNVIVLSWVSFFQDAASELLYPVLPLFLTVTLGAPASVVGLVEGVAEGTASVGKAVSGRLADRFRRRPLIAAGYGVSSVAKPLIGLASGWPVVLGARVIAFLALFGLANFSDALLILRAHALGLGFVGIVTAYALYNAVYAALSYPAGVVSDRLPRRLVFAVGLAAFAVAYLGLGLAGESTWVWPLFAVYGAYTALTDGVGRAWVANLLPPGALGTGLGLYQGVAGACALTAGIWAGLAWGGTGRVPLLVSGAIV